MKKNAFRIVLNWEQKNNVLIWKTKKNILFWRFLCEGQHVSIVRAVGIIFSYNAGRLERYK